MPDIQAVIGWRQRRGSLLALSWLLAIAVATATTQGVTPLDIETVLRLKSFPPITGFVSVTPDGRWIAYAVRDGREPAISAIFSETGALRVAGVAGAIWVADVATGKARQITDGRGTSWGPVWSPDGQRLAFYSDRDGGARLWIWDRARDDFRRLTDAIVRPFYELPEWSADGRWIAVALLPEGLSIAAANRLASRPVAGVDATVAAGASVSVFRSAAHASGVSRRLTGSDHPGFGGDGSLPQRLHWSPSGDAIYFVGRNRVWVVRPDLEELSPLTPNAWNREAVSIVSNQVRNIVWMPRDMPRLTITTRDPVTKREGVYTLDPKSREVTKMREEPRRYGRAFQAPVASDDGTTVVFISEDAQRPPDVWVMEQSLSTSRQVTRLNPDFDAATLGGAQIVEYLAPDGSVRRGALLLPSTYSSGQRYPLLVRAYPGPVRHSDDVFKFGLEGATGISNMQILATRGYAVLLAEIPQRVGTPMRDLVNGMEAAVSKVIELGVADPSRIGVFGQSYGGYATIAILTQSPRFKAGVMSAGIGDLISKYGTLTPSGASPAEGWTESGQGLLGGTLWKYRDRYIENSPIFYLDRVQAPLLIVHGDGDDPAQADQIFAGLRRLGKEVEYRRYANVGHLVTGDANLRDYWASVVRWFDKYVKNAAGTPSEQ